MPTLTLPYPVSTNRLYRRMGARMVKSDEARAYQHLAGALALAAHVKPLEGPIALDVTIHPKSPKKPRRGRPVRCLDVSNAIKAAEDALNGLAWLDDSQVAVLHARRGPPVEGGALVVKWGPHFNPWET